MARSLKGNYANVATLAQGLSGGLSEKPATVGVVRALTKNDLTVGCLTTKSIAFGFGVAVTTFDLVTTTCNVLAGLGGSSQKKPCPAEPLDKEQSEKPADKKQSEAEPLFKDEVLEQPPISCKSCEAHCP